MSNHSEVGREASTDFQLTQVRNEKTQVNNLIFFVLVLTCDMWACDFRLFVGSQLSWLERSPDKAEVGSSSLPGPTSFEFPVFS